MITKEEHEYNIEQKAKELHAQIYGEGSFIPEGKTYLQILTEYAINLMKNMLYLPSRDLFFSRVAENSFLKENKLYTKIYLSGTIEIVIETQKLGPEIYELVQKGKSGSETNNK